jgi:formylglycine-generating enzyme required for sulfatase activity
MKARRIALIMALFMLGLAAAFAAENPNMGTWKLNAPKSKFAPGATKNSTVVYEAAGDSVKVTTDGTAGDGKPVHTEWTGKFDGKEYPVTGGGASDTRSYKKVDDHTMTITNQTAGKVTTSGKITVSADGKSRTVTISGTDSSGKKVSSSAVYDKQ